ncbi:MAG: hypothetical protein AVDCRST_MAG88-2177, partial [uncultured Thermomicrobiales bacterium]
AALARAASPGVKSRAAVSPPSCMSGRTRTYLTPMRRSPSGCGSTVTHPPVHPVKSTSPTPMRCLTRPTTAPRSSGRSG